MVARLVTGIFALVFLSLGIVFVVVGLLIEEPRSGEPEDFVVVGAPIGAAGLLFAAAFAVMMRREGARRQRRRAGTRTTAEIVHATLKPYIRIGVLITYDVTLRFAGQTIARRISVVPGTPVEAGGTMDILYDPEDPTNLEPA